MFNELYFKNEIFDLFENARVLFNDYYNGKESYTNEDINAIKDILKAIKENIKNIENESEE